VGVYIVLSIVPPYIIARLQNISKRGVSRHTSSITFRVPVQLKRIKILASKSLLNGQTQGKSSLLSFGQHSIDGHSKRHFSWIWIFSP
jgi:hypothetical protein